MVRANRDLPAPDFCQLQLYTTLAELAAFKSEVAAADAVIIGSYVHQGPEVIDWVAACRRRGALCFYDIDTPVTLRQLATGGAEYLLPRCVPMFDIYFSFTGGPTLRTAGNVAMVLVERKRCIARWMLNCIVRRWRRDAGTWATSALIVPIGNPAWKSCYCNRRDGFPSGDSSSQVRSIPRISFGRRT